MDEEEGEHHCKKKGPMASKYSHSSHWCRPICCGLAIFIILSGIIALVLYLVYRPSKPHFSVMGAAVYNLTASSPTATALSTSMQFTIISRNPSSRSSDYFDSLSVYVMYRNQAITPPTPIPPLFLEKQSTVAVSPVLEGEFVPVSVDVTSGLTTDETYGVVSLRVVVMGRIKYKSGPFHSPWYSMFVTCDLLVGLKKGVYGQVPMLGSPDCHVDI